MWLTRISVKYPVFTIMMMFCLMVLGLASWQRMGVEEFPDVDFPFVVVYTTYPGASPETVESEITKKMEDQINTAPWKAICRLIIRNMCSGMQNDS